MKNPDYRSMKIGDIVARDFRTAEVFRNAGIDFCCGGAETLAFICTDKKIDIDELESKLIAVDNTPLDPAYNFSEWTLDVLCDHIVDKYHKETLELLPRIIFYTQKTAEIHGDKHPELHEIARIFIKVDTELRPHMLNEEEVLFPAIKEVLSTNSQNSKFITLRDLMIMKTEHEFAGSVLDLIRSLSNNYALPPDSTETYNIMCQLLQQFEDNLQMHVHLENNILYPKAFELAKKTD